ncbi:MAG TPA: hypothetical protein VHQ01_04915 [Pyrinomonadaceae bacterium]|nr:hypothetical protein [Pyrinomonadaceae bacterium]
MIPTMLAMEFSSGEIVGAVVAVIVAFLGSNVVSAGIAARAVRRKTGAETNAIDAGALTELSKEFREVMKAFTQAQKEALSSEEQHSLERIENGIEMSALKEQVAKCELEHQEWADCKANMLALLVTIEPELQRVTSQPTLLAAVASLKGKIEDA